jgi:hypothetical protein
MLLIAAELPDKDGAVVFLPATIGGCITDKFNKQHTVVYTDTFPDGITIKMQLDDFASCWQNALALEDMTIEFTPETVPEVQH